MIKTALTLAALTLAAPAYAQQCGSTEEAYQALSEKYNETRQGMGFAESGAIVEFWASITGSWSAIVSFPDGTTCLIASGQDWTFAPEPAEPNL